MTLNIEVFYSFQSPYSYLALDGIYDLANQFDVELLWQPFSARAAGQPTTPGQVLPEKLSYLIEDTKRYAEENNIPLVFPETWPAEEYDPGRAIRGALVAADLGCLMIYNYKVGLKWWGRGENPNDDGFVTELCEELDIDPGEFLSKVSASDTRERIKGIYKRGKKMGVFDTPTFVIDKERIYGIDKLPYLAQRLEKMGLKK